MDIVGPSRIHGCEQASMDGMRRDILRTILTNSVL